MPFAIDLKFIYEPLTSVSDRPTFDAEKPKEKMACLPYRANAYVCSEWRTKKIQMKDKEQKLSKKKKEKSTHQQREKKNGMVHARTRRQRQKANKERV